MIATLVSRHSRLQAQRRAALIGAGVLLLAALFLFASAHPVPFLLWDESRNIVNALEMDRTGFGLITTYQGAPDLWNTKPPLLIWAMVASVRVFGASEWALRLPGMLASLGTLALTMGFVRRITGSIWTGALAAALLVLSPAWLGEHGARTADYEPLLTCFVTAYLVLLFAALHRVRPTNGQAIAIALCVIGAALTKSIAGVMPGLGVAVYLLSTRRVARVWRDWRYVAAGAAIVGAIGLFLALREAQAPGYLAAAWYNDVGGRFAAALETERKPASFYLHDLWAGYFAATMLLIVSPLAMRWMSARARDAVRYALAIVVTFLLVISLAGSKLHHYVLPVLPMMAIVAAITARAIVLRVAAAWQSDDTLDRIVSSALLLVAIVPLSAAAQHAVATRYGADPAYEGAASRRYGPLFERLATQGVPITVIDPGFVRYGDAHYVAVLRGYRLMWARRGVAIGWTTRLTASAGKPGVLVSCKPEIVPTLLARGPDIGGVTGCAAVVGR